MMQSHYLFGGGKFLQTDNSYDVKNPYNEDVVSTTYLAGKKELEAAIDAAVRVSDDLKQLPSHKRYSILKEIADKLEENKEDFALLIAREAAKPYQYALSETKRAIQTFTVAAEEAKRLPKEYISLDWTPAGENKEGLVKYFPVGPVAAISPFNFPLNLAVHKLAPAIAAGCPIILKPATKTPLATLELARIIAQTDLPAGAVSILPMNRETGDMLVTDERLKLLTFTGSPAVGWKMKQNAGKKKVLLELGGNAGVVVAESADIDQAVKRSVVGGFAYAGQVCIHTQRIYVHENIFEKFRDKFIDKVKTLKPGPPDEVTTDITSMIDEDNAKRVGEWVDEAVRNGAEVLTGGKQEGAFYSPTVLTNTKNDMSVCSMEVFGPVVILEKYSNFEHAVNELNYSRYGLQAGVFSDSLKEINYAMNHIHVGGIIINDVPTFRVDHMPYGGVKDSGMGREGIKYAIQEMMESKILVRNT
ncbi:MAG: aldehyde dehydrogenase family protein [Bacteroidales bacterium]|nr:aldehyde dehydrogenase family protein [Bacteroidales bacterium]MCF8334280.1 aldehyde dehydrogenase family protein [Bacteroidales bacterium]